jgi:16S rRNA (guanine966-N2)-methyltransferase
VRVIAGIAGGIPLHTPRSDLRPTMDMVKGAIFSSLGEGIVGARVLDLFAGSGALGIEALSRGAASVTFVESDRRAVAAIEKNLEKTKLAGTAVSVQSDDVFRYLDRRGGAGDQRGLADGRAGAPGSFDIILADPPYAKAPGERDFTPELLGSPSLRAALAADGIFVLEHLPGAALPLGAWWECVRDKRYGATAVAFLRRAAAETATPADR